MNVKEWNTFKEKILMMSLMRYLIIDMYTVLSVRFVVGVSLLLAPA